MYYLYQALSGRIQDGTKTFVSVERSNKKKNYGGENYLVYNINKNVKNQLPHHRPQHCWWLSLKDLWSKTLQDRYPWIIRKFLTLSF